MKFLSWLISWVVLLFSCTVQEKPFHCGDKPYVVASTGIVADVVRHVGDGVVCVEALMGPGTDPHLYKATPGDINKLLQADLIFYHGLHLEGKMTEVFEGLKAKKGNAFAITDGIPREMLIIADSATQTYDPHVWFSMPLWKQVTLYVADILSAHYNQYHDKFLENAQKYMDTLMKLHEYAQRELSKIPDSKRVLITSHDAFAYLGKEYGLEVHTLQGVSTLDRYGIADIEKLADLIVQRQIPAIFVETSVNNKGILALKELVRKKGWDVRIGGTLYSDALGEPGTIAGTLPGMFKSNIDTIVNGLGYESEESRH
ncbi:MAG: zinc ABC transporter solute-binding protein [Chlorobi bacterium]|nr:zinc ABC transporter solute-binding protein [Chlorobiota bacterium]